MEKIKNIEFLRIIGCLTIILLHLMGDKRLYFCFPDIEIYSKLHSMTINGAKAVDLFFIISGFFFFYKFNYAQTLWQFFKKKLIRLYPVFIFVLFLYLICSFWGTIEFKFYNNILDLLFLNGTGLVMKSGNVGRIWFVGSMLWSFLFYFYILQNYKKKNVILIIALITLFCYEFIIHVNHGVIGNNKTTFYNFINMGMLRALGGIGISFFIAEWYENNIDKIKSIILTVKQKCLITIIEFVCLYFIINNLMFHQLKNKNDMIYIVVFIAIIVLFLLKQGYISKILDNSIWDIFSKYTYSIYLTHCFVFNILKASLWKSFSQWVFVHPIENFLLALFLALILGIFTYHFVEKPCADYFKKAENPCARRERERERESNPSYSKP